MAGCRKRHHQQCQAFCPRCFDTHEKYRKSQPRNSARHVFYRNWSRTDASKAFFPHTEHLHSVAAHGGGTSEAPSLLVGHHEQRGQALLHQPGKALVVQPQQSYVHPLDHCGNTEKTQISTSCTRRWSNTWSVGQFGTGRCRLTWKLNTWTLLSPLSNSLWA